MLVSIILAIVISMFVLYCLFNGSKIKFETLPVRTIYWPLSAVTLGIFLTMTVGMGMINVVCIGVIFVMSLLYSSIPSGFNESGISLRGIFFPYRKIENIKGEYLNEKYRLNFMVRNMQFYLEVKDDDDKMLKNCEFYYKKEKNK